MQDGPNTRGMQRCKDARWSQHLVEQTHENYEYQVQLIQAQTLDLRNHELEPSHPGWTWKKMNNWHQILRNLIALLGSG